MLAELERAEQRRGTQRVWIGREDRQGARLFFEHGQELFGTRADQLPARRSAGNGRRLWVIGGRRPTSRKPRCQRRYAGGEARSQRRLQRGVRCVTEPRE